MINYQEYIIQSNKEDIRHEKKMKKLNEELKAYQKICKHNKGSNYWPDPSGNSDSWSECKLCGASV